MSFINSIFSLLRFNQRNWKAVVLCIFAATVFWFFNALNKNYSANINFPVVFDFDREKFVPVRQLPEQVRINVSGLGWDLFRKSSGLKVPPLVIPLEHPDDVKKIVASTLPPLFATQLEGLQINFVLTDTMFVEIDQKASRMVFLKIDSVKQFMGSGFGVSSDIVIEPDSVLLEGPASVVFALPEIIPISLPNRNIDEPYNEEVEVNVGTVLIKRDPPVVTVSFQVDNLGEVTDTIPVKVIHNPGSARPSVEPVTIVITYKIPISLRNKIHSDSLLAIIDLKNYARGTHKVVPSIRGISRFAHSLKVDTVRVNF